MPECVEMPAPVMQATLEAPRKWSTRAASSDSASAGAAGASERSCRTVIVAVQIAAAGASIVAVRMAAGPSIGAGCVVGELLTQPPLTQPPWARTVVGEPWTLGENRSPSAQEFRQVGARKHKQALDEGSPRNGVDPDM